jgi:hypothetical protein
MTIMSSQMANSTRVQGFTRSHFLWGQDRGSGNPTKGWLDKPPIWVSRVLVSLRILLDPAYPSSSKASNNPLDVILPTNLVSYQAKWSRELP